MQSKNLSKIQTRPIEDLLGRIRTAKSKGDRTITLSLQEMTAISDSLSQVMTRLVTVQEDVIEALRTAQQAQTINVEMDGGNFSSKK